MRRLSKTGLPIRKLHNRFIYLFLDYDGTLAPIVKAPDKAVMPKKTKAVLRRLANKPGIKLAIISGRALDDVKKRIGIRDVVYVGNHGFEINGPRLKFKNPAPPRYRKLLERIKGRLREKLYGIKGVFIEDKGLSLSVHYRRARAKDTPKIETIFYETMIIDEVRESVRTRPGKKVLEIRPPVAWDKGKAVLWLLARQKFTLGKKGAKILPIYLGDDITDEDAFKALRNKGITVFVGRPKRSSAEFYLKNTEDVIRFLEGLLRLREGKSSWQN